MSARPSGIPGRTRVVRAGTAGGARLVCLSGYAAQRTNDLQGGLYAADQSSPQSRNFDVAALYFPSPVAGGGYGGYLPSDATPNSWLTGTAREDAGGLSGGRLAVQAA